ncbi:MAG: AAA family ATPase [Desulfovibrionaceae bacterium]|nr:AAA family ATPase [Desulfovibrionaceae bacterium]
MKNELSIPENIPRLCVDDMIQFLTCAYTNLLDKKAPVKTLPTVMLWSAPGLGKSQGIRQLADRLSQTTKRETRVTDVRLLLFNPVDLRGIPVADAKRKAAVWLKPQIFDMDPSDQLLNILFLDEISSAPPSVQAAAYQLVLDRTVGEHRLPDNCLVIAAGNRVYDRSVAWQMPQALANRLCHLEIICDPVRWRRWAIANQIHPLVLGYIAQRPDQLHAAGDDELAFPTPRTWEMVSQILHYVGNNEAGHTLISGCIGRGSATEFRTMTDLFDQIPPLETIFSGRCSKVPKKPDTLYVLTSAMSSYALSHRHDLTAIGHSITYALRFPPEFTTLLLQDYISFEPTYRSHLMGIPAFSDWISRYGKLL